VSHGIGERPQRSPSQLNPGNHFLTSVYEQLLEIK